MNKKTLIFPFNDFNCFLWQICVNIKKIMVNKKKKNYNNLGQTCITSFWMWKHRYCFGIGSNQALFDVKNKQSADNQEGIMWPRYQTHLTKTSHKTKNRSCLVFRSIILICIEFPIDRNQYNEHLLLNRCNKI